MKRRIFISLLLALVMSLALSVPVLAGEPWDVEDPCAADSGDIWYGYSQDGNSWEFDGGRNLYRDDATDTGNLDSVGIWTFTLENIDLPNKSSSSGIGVATGKSPDTWYWATEPRGYNLPSITRTPDIDLFDAGQFDVVVGTWDSYETYKWEGGYLDGKVLGEAISQVGKCNGNYYRLDIPIGTEITCYGMRVDGVKLWISQDGAIQFTMGRNMQFSNECTISKLVGNDWGSGWEVVVTFTEIYRGVPR